MREPVPFKRTARLRDMIAQSISQAMPVHQMEKLARRVISDYNLRERSGFPASVPIPQMEAAQRITEDIDREGRLIRFVEELIDVHDNGVMGRRVPIRFLAQIIQELKIFGMSFNAEYGIFVEDGQRTKGWGTLQEGLYYEFAFLRMDVVRNTRLVRRYTETQVSGVYADLKRMAQRIVDRREGRIWKWEGDGGLAAFFLGNKNVLAALSGIEILYELFLYNRLSCPLEEPLSIRLAVHTGQSQFFHHTEEIQSEALQRVEKIEAEQAESDTLTISPVVYTDLGSKLSRFFQPVQAGDAAGLYRCRMEWR